MELKSKRLLLREWREEDADALYHLARVPQIGEGAGFQPHPDRETSLSVIRQILSQPETYAVTSRKTGEVIGSAGLSLSLEGNAEMKAGEAEVGYWVGKHLWGWGFATETVEILIRHARLDLGLTGLWGGCFPENAASRRVLEKVGFTFHHRGTALMAQLGEVREVSYFYLPLTPA